MVAVTAPMRTSVGMFVALLGLVACGTDEESPPDVPVARATWYQDVAPILSKHCMSCHQDGGIGPFALTDYDSARESSAHVIDAVERGIMPPFDAREEADCTPRFDWVDDPRLTAEEKATLHAWIEDGFALGTEAAIPPPPITDLEGVTRTLTPVQGFTTTGTRDQFVCFVLDPGNDQLQWMTGLQVRPGNPLVVHHAVITQVGNDQGEADALVAQRGIGVPFDCDDMATPGDFVVNIWTPGNQPFSTAGDIAVPILPRAKLVMQIHYHPAGLTNDLDVTEVDLRISSQWPHKMYFVTAFGNEAAAPNLEPGPGDDGTPRFLIPANAADHTERMFRVIPDLGGLQDVRLFSVNPHMHLVGTHIRSKIIRPVARGNDPQTECLANGGWNFDWQRTYLYDAPLAELPSVAAGDRIEISCRWNNTLDNPFVQRMLADSNLPPMAIDVALGEQTTNEMCLEIFGLAIDAPAQPMARHAPLELKLPTLGPVPSLRELSGALR